MVIVSRAFWGYIIQKPNLSPLLDHEMIPQPQWTTTRVQWRSFPRISRARSRFGPRILVQIALNMTSSLARLLALSLTHRHAHTHTVYAHRGYTQACAHALSLSLSHTHAHTHSLSLIIGVDLTPHLTCSTEALKLNPW